MSDTLLKPAVLLVDDEDMVLQALLRVLRDPHWELVAVNSGPDALAELERRPFSAIISDQRMPLMSGLELMSRVKEKYPEVTRIILTGYAEMSLVVKAINQGEVYRFFTKPWSSAELKKTLREVVERAGREKADFQKITAQLHHASLETVMALAEAIELKDHYTKGHCSRVRDYSLKMAMALQLPSGFCRDLIYASLLHDCGKIGVSEAVLNVDGPLSEEQIREVRRHPVLGFEITNKIDYLRPASLIVRQHHERWDGTGYPDGLKGQEITMGARIVAVADSFDAMTSTRPYRRALDFKQAMAELAAGRGSQFDPSLVDLFISLMADDSADSAATSVRRLLLVGLDEDLSRVLRDALPEGLYKLDFIAQQEDEKVSDLSLYDMIICAWADEAQSRLLAFLDRCRRCQPEVIRVLQVDRDRLSEMAGNINKVALYSYLVSPVRGEDVQSLVDNAFEWRAMARTLKSDALNF